MDQSPAVNKILQRVYFDPKKGYGEVHTLYHTVRKYKITLDQVREWVKEQNAY
jgi:pyrroloquinoline quinone (PQQ) biosynthesis protein C